jgi:PPOX class probable F420-dependent enzyme
MSTIFIGPGSLAGATRIGAGPAMLQDGGMLSAAERGFLDRVRVGHLATADARGAPHVVPVCFAVSDDTLYITIDQKPKGPSRALKRLRNLIENPAAGFVADRWDEDWTRLGWVMLRGSAEILDDGAEHDQAQALLCKRYPQYRTMQLAGLPVIAVRLERVAHWGDLEIDRG